MKNIDHADNNPDLFSAINFLLVNTQGFQNKKQYNKELITRSDADFVSMSEICMRMNEAEDIAATFKGFNSTAQTPDLRMNMSTKLAWRPTQGVALIYKEEWAQYIEKIKITSRAVIIQYKLNKMRGCTLIIIDKCVE